MLNLSFWNALITNNGMNILASLSEDNCTVHNKKKEDN